MIRVYESVSTEDFFCTSLRRFSGLPIDPENMKLFALIARRLDGDGIVPMEKLLRRRAALCLRTGGGGGLYACAVLARSKGDYLLKVKP